MGKVGRVGVAGGRVNNSPVRDDGNSCVQRITTPLLKNTRTSVKINARTQFFYYRARRCDYN